MPRRLKEIGLWYIDFIISANTQKSPSQMTQENGSEGFKDMPLLPSREFVRRLIAALWIAVYVWVLVRTLVLRNASPQVFGDAEYLEQIYILALSSPLSGLISRKSFH
jgi:hypothetical protein